jgi:predicted dehydrogenase
LSAEPVRLGLVGAGPWGRNFIATIAGLPTIRLAAVASSNPANRELIDPDCMLHGAWSDMYAAADLEGVIIATPPASHAEIVLAALERGFAVLVEKPLTLELAEAEALAARAAGSIAQVDHTDLYNPAWRALLERVAEIGPIREIECAWFNRGPLRADAPGRWDYGPHPLALCIDLLGAEPTRVTARRTVREGDAELVEADLKWDQGPHARVRIGNAGDHKCRRLEAQGESGTITYDDLAPDKALLDGTPVAFPPEAPLAAVLTRFAMAIGRGQPDNGDVKLGLEVVRTLARIDLALEAGSGAVPARMHPL